MIDTHAHLNEIEDVEAAIRRAGEAGVESIIAVGMDLASNRENLELSRRFPGLVHPALGYHPWSQTLGGFEANLSFLQEHLANCVALGEVGLDYKVKIRKRTQQEIFSRLLMMAARFDRPVIVHARFSHHRAYRLVREAGIRRAVFHWYSGPLEVLREIMAAGFFISATPALSYSLPHQEAIKVTPLDRILLETDAPTVFQEKVSEPADLIITARELSRVKRLDLQQVIEITTRNAKMFFGL